MRLKQPKQPGSARYELLINTHIHVIELRNRGALNRFQRFLGQPRFRSDRSFAALVEVLRFQPLNYLLGAWLGSADW
jgi:hypothetical protein